MFGQPFKPKLLVLPTQEKKGSVVPGRALFVDGFSALKSSAQPLSSQETREQKNIPRLKFYLDSKHEIILKNLKIYIGEAFKQTGRLPLSEDDPFNNLFWDGEIAGIISDGHLGVFEKFPFDKVVPDMCSFRKVTLLTPTVEWIKETPKYEKKHEEKREGKKIISHALLIMGKTVFYVLVGVAVAYAFISEFSKNNIITLIGVNVAVFLLNGALKELGKPTLQKPLPSPSVMSAENMRYLAGYFDRAAKRDALYLTKKYSEALMMTLAAVMESCKLRPPEEEKEETCMDRIARRYFKR